MHPPNPTSVADCLAAGCARTSQLNAHIVCGLMHCLPSKHRFQLSVSS